MVELLTAVEGVIMSEKFKTSYLFKFQPVTMTAVVDLYVKYIRPETNSPYLFVTSTGKQLGQGYVSKAVGMYFEMFGLDICTNTVRKLVEVR